MANSDRDDVTPPDASSDIDLRLEQTDDCFGEGVVVRVAATADRQRDAGVGQPLCVAHRQLLRAAVDAMHQVARAVIATIVDGLLKRIEDEVRAGVKSTRAS